MHSALYNQLTIFHTIAAEGSISGAARKLGMAVPSVSKSLKRWSMQLLTRRGWATGWLVVYA